MTYLSLSIHDATRAQYDGLAWEEESCTEGYKWKKGDIGGITLTVHEPYGKES